AGAEAGHGSVLLIAGEAGVGKSRLIDEAVRRTRARGYAAAVGHCIELGSSGVPFAPIKEALRTVGALLDDIGGELAGIGARVDARRAASDPVGVGAESAQTRFFDACLERFERITSQKPLLLVIEDIHWADPSTLELMKYIIRRLDDVPLALIATLRSDDLHRRHPIQPFLGELQRTANTERLDVLPFTEHELGQQLDAILSEPPEPDLVRRIYARSNGNPLYAEEVLAAEKMGQPLSAALRDIVLARVATLGEETQELLRIMAAGGQRIATRTVADVARSDPETIQPSLREAVDHHIIVPLESGGDEYVEFRHALVQEAIYGELLPGERSRLHTRFAEAIEAGRHQDEATLAQLAHHWSAAHQPARALPAMVAAAVSAESLHAFAVAHLGYEQALELWDHVPDAEERAGMGRTDLVGRAARAAAVSNPPRAAALMMELLRTTDGQIDDTRAGLLHERYGRYAWLAGDGLAAVDACREGVRLVPADPPSTARARVLASLGQILMVTMQPEMEEICAQAVDAARTVGADDVECHALESLAQTHVYLGELDLSLVQHDESLAIALRLGSVDDAARVHVNVIDALSHSGLLREAGERAEVSYAFATAHGLAHLAAMSLAEGALALYRLGEWDRSEEMLERARRHGIAGVPTIMAEERLAMLDVGRGRNETAAGRIAALRPMTRRVVEAQFITPLAEAAAELALWQRRPLDARDEVGDACRRLPAEPAYLSRLGPLIALGLRAEADISETARAQKDAPALGRSRVVAEEHLDTMQRLHDVVVGRLPNFRSQAEAWLAQCLAEKARLDGQSDPAAWERCVDAFGAIPMAYPRAYAEWRQATANLATGGRRPSVAATLLRDARSVALELGARPLLNEIDILAARAGLDLTGDVTTAVEPTPLDSTGLTRREREILRLIAHGRSNRQIAEQLFITEGTAGTHVSHILGKLGVRGRTEAAAMAHRLGLVD
ncbi:MAG: AAA family ATPase, partial [Chloroflexota bacterium]